MRLSPFAPALMALALIAAPAFAQQGKAVFGSRTCSEKVPCADSEEAISVSSEQWAAYGSNCAAVLIGRSQPEGFIDPMAGLDGSGCMTALAGALPNTGVGSHLAPRCCVVALPTNTCAVHCDLVVE